MATFLIATAEADTECSNSYCGVIVEAGHSLYPARLRDDAYCSPLCRERHTKRNTQQRRRDNATTNRHDNDNRIYRKYGVTKEEWEALYSLQLGRCAICTVALSETKKVCTDHDHETGKVRGLLCSLCNVGIGYFNDDPDLLDRAIRYLRETTVSAPDVVAAGGGETTP